jgi:4-hydroxy-tetrahydrodipicolinate reductase
MKKKILVIGYQGNMGQIAIKAIESNPKLQYIAGCGSKDDLEAKIKHYQPDAAIDLTDHLSVFNNTTLLLENNIKPVIGASGLTLEQIQIIEQICNAKKIGGIIAPNFSIGAILMMMFAAQAAKYFPNSNIQEVHHLKKKDAPSATAIETAKLIDQNKTRDPVQHSSVETLQGSLGAKYKSTNIQSIRMPGKVAEQTVCFANFGEILTIKHETISRESFVQGISLACEKVFDYNILIKNMNQFF